MSLTGLMLIPNTELIHLYGLWALGAATVAGLFLYRRSRIVDHDTDDR
jgi:hypothetical protein